MPNSYEDRILRVLSYIHDNPAGDLSLDTIADVAAMSRFHWHRVFRAMTGETCAQAVRRIRLHRASIWLVNDDRSIDQIAADIGYPNTASFARAFAEMFGARPASFRAAGRALPPVSTLKSGDFRMYPVTIRQEPKRRLASIRHVGAYYKIGKAFENLVAICTSRNLWPDVGGFVGVYCDNPEVIPEDKLNSRAGVIWQGDVIPEGLEEYNLPGGKTAVMTYKGPYAGLAEAYQTLFGNWLPNSGEEPADMPCYEISLNSPRDTAPEDLLTEICLPLKWTS
ncbi:AraC family transcriptional regulator [Parasedimentitalea maritima]|uniref:AraC family transcriptional regulator n=1 Tax=Parasedimentitalea maritima TaxID=2578117 RepID=A0ABY2UZX7_9RHOB|nr:AraC family transcriptional regulator [Zongyanglinia marina]TLP69006.1 AraC family transcriptional regulator [Zongyanglinia marina]